MDFMKMLSQQCVKLTQDAQKKKRKLEEEAIEQFFKGNGPFPDKGTTLNYGIPKKNTNNEKSDFDFCCICKNHKDFCECCI